MHREYDSEVTWAQGLPSHLDPPPIPSSKSCLFAVAVVTAAIAEKASEFGAAGLQSPTTGREEKSATDLAAKLLLLDELVSLENDVFETKKKRSFPGFGSPLDRLSAGSVEHKGKQRDPKLYRKFKRAPIQCFIQNGNTEAIVSTERLSDGIYPVGLAGAAFDRVRGLRDRELWPGLGAADTQ
ncbi:hypothetical protein A6R68_11524, partial [Neotoma lepida]